MEFIAVTLNDPNDWNNHAEMLDYAFSEHYPKKLIEQGDTVKVTNIDGKDYSMVAASDFTIPFKEHQKTQVEVISHISNDLQAPINQGEKVGWLEIVCDGVSVGEVDIISENDIYGVSNIRLKNSFFSSCINERRKNGRYSKITKIYSNERCCVKTCRRNYDTRGQS